MSNQSAGINHLASMQADTTQTVLQHAFPKKEKYMVHDGDVQFWIIRQKDSHLGSWLE